jgi:hypothetical protein
LPAVRRVRVTLSARPGGEPGRPEDECRGQRGPRPLRRIAPRAANTTLQMEAGELSPDHEAGPSSS